MCARPDVIVAPGFALPALTKVTSTVPIVMAAGGDPVGAGWIRSLGHPGGNITGLSLQTLETTGKRLELLKELLPAAAPVAVIWDRIDQRQWSTAETGRAKGMEAASLEIREPREIEELFAAATAARAGGLLACADAVLFPHMGRVIELAERSRLPVMYDVQPYVDAGGLMSYAADIIEIWVRAASSLTRYSKVQSPGTSPSSSRPNSSSSSMPNRRNLSASRSRRRCWRARTR